LVAPDNRISRQGAISRAEERMSPRPNELPGRELRGLELSGNPLSRRSWRRPYVRHPKWGPTPLTFMGSWTLTFMGSWALTFMGSGTLTFGAAH
jgi:hypothetical protein